MLKPTRRVNAFSPTCQTLDTRLAPSGNFLASGFNELADAVKGVDHHHTVEHGTTTGTTHEGMKEHGHHHAK